MLHKGLVQPQIPIIDIIAAVGRGITAQSVGEGWVFEIAPVGDDIIFVALCPDICLYGKDDLLVLRIGNAGKYRGHIGLAVFAGIEGEIGAQHPCKTRLQRVSRHREGRDMQFAGLLFDRIHPFGLSPFQERPAYVHQVQLVVRVVGEEVVIPWGKRVRPDSSPVAIGSGILGPRQ